MKRVITSIAVLCILTGSFNDAVSQVQRISIQFSLGSAQVFMKDWAEKETEYYNKIGGSYKRYLFNHAPFMTLGGTVSYHLSEKSVFLLNTEYYTVSTSANDLRGRSYIYVSEWENTVVPVSLSYEYSLIPHKRLSPFFGGGVTCFMYRLKNNKTVVTYDDGTYAGRLDYPFGSTKKDRVYGMFLSAGAASRLSSHLSCILRAKYVFSETDTYDSYVASERIGPVKTNFSGLYISVGLGYRL